MTSGDLIGKTHCSLNREIPLMCLIFTITINIIIVIVIVIVIVIIIIILILCIDAMMLVAVLRNHPDHTPPQQKAYRHLNIMFKTNNDTGSTNNFTTNSSKLESNTPGCLEETHNL